MTEKQKAATLAKDFYNKIISYNEFILEYPDNSEIDEIIELFDLIEHEPKKNGLFGVGGLEHKLHIKRINK
ncbi:MAG: hypothetical protein KAT68_06895 [Bacteroidales bacterium]|nr:hypothetical protein [Bacteroidales bacterium]